MNPWMIAALLAGVIGVATLAKNAAQAALPRVTSFGLTYFPIPGVASLWDLWVTSLSGLTGTAMLARIPGGQMIYIPAALIAKQPTNADWSYTFTPRGQAATFTIVVPAAILQAYAAAPKSALQAAAIQSHAYAQSQLLGKGITFIKAQPTADVTAPTAATDVNAIIAQVKAVIASLPPPGSDASVYGLWLATTALQVPSLITNVQAAITAIQNNTATGDLATLQSLLPTLMGLVGQAAAAAQSAPPSASASTDTGPGF